MIITADEIVTWLDSLSPEDLKRITGGCIHRDDDAESTLEQISGYGFDAADAEWQSFLERSSSYREQRNDEGTLISVSFDSVEDLDTIRDMTAAYVGRVWGELSAEAAAEFDRAIAPMTMRDWSGDHEDYNGSYIEILMDIIIAYVNKEA